MGKRFTMLRSFAYLLPAFLIGSAAASQTAQNAFADDPTGGKVHRASGCVCPRQIGLFERDAVGERDPDTGADYCAYSALDGVYGTIVIAPVTGPFDAKAALAQDFIEQEGSGARKISEGAAKFGGVTGVYTRTYETTSIEDLHYRVFFAARAVGQWAVEATVEFASPRDDGLEREFLRSIYSEAAGKLALVR